MEQKTVVWNPPTDEWDLELVRTADMVPDGGYLIDHGHKVLLKKGQQIPAPTQCGLATLWTTEYENIFLTQDAGNWEEMGDDLDISKYIEERDDYIMWRLEEMLGAKGDLLQQKLCKQEFQRPANGIFCLKDNQIVKLNGAVIEYITCMP